VRDPHVGTTTRRHTGPVDQFDDAMLDMTEAIRRRRVGLVLYGPTRDDYNRIMAPIWRRERICQQLEWVMPGRKPGVFIRTSKGPA
jgi:hypothetical protein